MKLSGKVALVTGASSGIGMETAVEFANQGSDVIANYFRNQEAVEEICKRIQKMDRQCLPVQADVTKAEQVQNMVNTGLEKFSKIDILVNNAGGILGRSTIADMTDQLWDEQLNLNLKSIFYCCRAVIPQMVSNKDGVIINLSSIAARMGGAAGGVPYATAKAAVEGFTRGLAKEVADDNIRVVAIAPGAINTPFHKDPKILEGFKPMIPMKRIATPDEVAKVIVFLATDDASYVTGTVYDVSGGFMV
jgi:3-oxoacyl-[acyl-carrier protein] reductase